MSDKKWFKKISTTFIIICLLVFMIVEGGVVVFLSVNLWVTQRRETKALKEELKLIDRQIKDEQKRAERAYQSILDKIEEIELLEEGLGEAIVSFEYASRSDRISSFSDIARRYRELKERVRDSTGDNTAGD